MFSSDKFSYFFAYSINHSTSLMGFRTQNHKICTLINSALLEFNENTVTLYQITSTHAHSTLWNTFINSTVLLLSVSRKTEIR